MLRKDLARIAFAVAVGTGVAVGDPLGAIGPGNSNGSGCAVGNVSVPHTGDHSPLSVTAWLRDRQSALRQRHVPTLSDSTWALRAALTHGHLERRR